MTWRKGVRESPRCWTPQAVPGLAAALSWAPKSVPGGCAATLKGLACVLGRGGGARGCGGCLGWALWALGASGLLGLIGSRSWAAAAPGVRPKWPALGTYLYGSVLALWVSTLGWGCVVLLSVLSVAFHVFVVLVLWCSVHSLCVSFGVLGVSVCSGSWVSFRLGSRVSLSGHGHRCRYFVRRLLRVRGPSCLNSLHA